MLRCGAARTIQGRKRVCGPTIVLPSRPSAWRCACVRIPKLTSRGPRGLLRPMTYRTPGIVRLLSLVLLPLAAGCYHENYTYRAVSNVNVARARETVSDGPLILLSLDDLPQETEKPKRKTASELLESL